tara:strand:+ start:1250 stop:1618 length:369 start_codon:yes stop_codon:yes gene_type:complete
MGYRSQVVLAIGEALIPQFMVTMAKSPQARAMCFGDGEPQRDFQGEKGSLFFVWEGIKWYDSYEEIQAIEDFINWAEDKLEINGKEIDGDDHFRFVRIGEEYEDIEIRGYGFDIHPVRSIEY